MTIISGRRSLQILKGKEKKLRYRKIANRKVMGTLKKWRRETLRWLRATGVFLKDKTTASTRGIIRAGG
jgi:hypothetical protein